MTKEEELRTGIPQQQNHSQKLTLFFQAIIPVPLILKHIIKVIHIRNIGE